MILRRKKWEIQDTRLDRVGLAVLRVLKVSEEEMETTATSPHLYARLRSRIVERSRRAEADNLWLTLLAAARRAIPAMVGVMATAGALSWVVAMNTPRAKPAGEMALSDLREGGDERVIFAGANSLSSDEMLATIMRWDERETERQEGQR